MPPLRCCSYNCRGWKSLSSSITPLSTASDRFCAIKVCDSSNCHFLLCSVYLPNEYHPSSYTDYLNTLGELHGLISSQAWDGIYLIGDFNVDFQCHSSNTLLLSDFMSEVDLLAADLPFRSSIQFTYERDDGLSRSWINLLTIMLHSCH